MHDDDGLALGVAALLEIDRMQIGDFQRPRPVGFDFGVEGAAVGGTVGHRVSLALAELVNQPVEYASEIRRAASRRVRRLPFF
jgi:hypothetical protein